MHGLPRDTGFGRLVQILIAQHKVSRAVGVQKQQRLIKEGKKSSQRYKDIVEVTGGRLTPEWIEADLEALKGVVKERPTREMIDVPVDEVQIVELYSK